MRNSLIFLLFLLEINCNVKVLMKNFTYENFRNQIRFLNIEFDVEINHNDFEGI